MKKFVIGLFCGLFVLPVVEALTDMALCWIESGKTIPSRWTSRSNMEIAKMQQELTEESPAAIGFQIPNDDFEEYEEDE